MDPASVAKLDQAGAGLKDTAKIIAAMAQEFVGLGVAPGEAVGHAINLLAQMLMWQQPEEDM